MPDVFIDWNVYQRRSATLAREMNLEMHFLEWRKFRRKALFPIRYIGQFIQTLLILKRKNPNLVVVKGVPIFAPFAVWMFSKLTGTKYVIDAHNGTFERKWGKLFKALKMIGQSAEVILIHNKPLQEEINLEALQMKSYVLEDRIPVPEKINSGSIMVTGNTERSCEKINDNDISTECRSEKLQITVISSLSSNEDIAMVLDSLGGLKNIDVYVTGNIHRGRGKTRALIRKPPENVIFTGYLPEPAYWDLLRKSDILLINDVRDNVLSCGGYESIAVQKPLVISKNNATKQYYMKGAVLYEREDKQSIITAVNLAAKEKNRLTAEIIELQKIKNKEWEKKFLDLMKILDQ